MKKKRPGTDNITLRAAHHHSQWTTPDSLLDKHVSSLAKAARFAKHLTAILA